MNNGGTHEHPMHVAHRYRDISCAECQQGFLAFGRQKVCVDCKKLKALSPEGPRKQTAQRAVKDAVRRGTIVRQPCVICAVRGRIDPKSHGHHEDYSKPLDVVWLCSFHHIYRHRQINSLRSQSLPCPALTAAELVAEEVRSHDKVRAEHPTWKIRPAPWDADYGPSATYFLHHNIA